MASADLRRSVAWGARALTYFVYVVVLINEIILVLGFFLLLFGANPDAGFAEWAYRNLDRVMEPFRGIFSTVPVGTGSGDIQPILDTSVLFAMIVYGILALVLRSVIDWLAGRIHALDNARARQEHDAQVLAAQVAAQAAAQPQAYVSAVPTSPAPPSVPPAPPMSPAPPLPPDGV